MRRKRIGIGVFLIIFLVVGGFFMQNQTESSSFSKTELNQNNSGATEAPASAMEPARLSSDDSIAFEYEESTGETAASGGAGNDGSVANIARQRLVIKSAAVEAEAPYEELGRILSQVEQLVERSGGYIVSTDDSTSLNTSSAYVAITFRVPSERFNDVLRDLDGESVTILRRDISGEDVTDEFVDNESRLKNLEATAAQLRLLLEEAATVEEAIQVMDSLTMYEEEIEIIKGRQQYLQESADMSLITFNVRSEYVPQVSTTNIGWSPSITAQRALNDLKELGQGIVDFLIVLAIWIPVWVPLVFLGLFLVRVARRMWGKYGPSPATANKTPAAAQNPPEINP